MKKLGLVMAVVGLTAAVWAGFFWKRAPAPLSNASAATAAEAPDDDKVDRLAREVAALRRVAAAQALSTAARTPAPAAAPRPALPRVPIAERREALMSTLQDRYRSETIDPKWSPTRIQEIKAAFATTLPEVAVLSAECASTLCKVVVEHPDADSQGSLAERAPEAQGLGTPTYYLLDRHSTPPRTTLFMARAGHRLPRLAM
jgi:hypothetical protein